MDNALNGAGGFMFTRRQLLMSGTAAGAAVLLPAELKFMRRAFAAIAGGTLDPAAIPKYAMPLVIPPAMPM
ncbi:MAG TPA: hypothetical protein VFR86_17540, partial [Burkholderiaceae bacterium]|nr:hypothetical protein [Burkholderiaceae bacterium]